MSRSAAGASASPHGVCAAACLLLSAIAGSPLTARAQTPVDYAAEIQPLFTRNCAGGACHVGGTESGVDLRDHMAARASTGVQYGGQVIVPFDAAASPLYRKIAAAEPEFGVRMPRGRAALAATEIALIGRWIDEGARRVPLVVIRGDLDQSGRLEISDAIFGLQYLFLGGPPPWCDAVADIDGDGILDINDSIGLLGWLFLRGVPPAPLSDEQVAECSGSNRAPAVEPIGTIQAREGIEVAFPLVASDPDGDELRFTVDRVPDGMTVGLATGLVTWTPRVGESGDYRVRFRVEDDGVPALSVIASGLVRVVEGNRPPSVQAIGTIYAREGVRLVFDVVAGDPEGDELEFALSAGPPGAVIDAASGRLTWTPAPGQAGEYALSILVTDGGSPRRSSQVDGTVVCLDASSPLNQPPAVPRRAVHRTYLGREIRFDVGASDPDGHAIAYVVRSLPRGATLDPATGAFFWQPEPDQLGPAYAVFAAIDDGAPPAETEAVYTFQVRPPDPCVEVDCDPATGCGDEPLSIEVDCCGPERPRVGEPLVECPEGRVLYVGRNIRGFGRMQNCDFLPIVPFPQGGASVRFHVEARCVSIAGDAVVRVVLEWAEGTIIDRTRLVPLQLRADGFAQRLGLIFSLDPGLDYGAIEGESAMLSVTMTDASNVTVSRRLRVVLTTRAVAELPEPDTIDLPAGEAGCVGCHRPLSPTGERHGLETAHPWFALSCTDCHGGDAAATTRSSAHVGLPFGAEPEFIRDWPSDALDGLSPQYLQFVNPSDLRVADRGCGSQSPANVGSGCHQSIVASVRKSVMSTYAGHYTLPRYLAGAQGRESFLAAIDIVDEDFDPATAPEGAVASFSALRGPDVGVDRSTGGACMDIYLPKSCPTCHLHDFGPNNANGNFRSSGCAACHMVYDENGLSRSADPVVSKDFPPHPRTHQLTSAIPTEQCAHCHFQGGRIGLAYRGIREGGFDAARTPEHAVPLGREIHAHDSNYYFVDEDDRNDWDETPPDLHAAAGMVCADCHIGGDVHGDGHMYGSERHQVGVDCEDCHGTVRAEIQEDPADGQFKNRKGFALRHVRRGADDRILLRRALDGVELEVPQILRILESGDNQAMAEAMGVNEGGYSHTDSLECYACHTSWRLTCFGCHVTIDDSGTGRNQTTGQVTQGRISVSRSDYSTEFFALGRNHRGKISPLCSSMSILLSYADANGDFVYRDRPRTSSDGKLGFGWNPFHHHTVSRVPQNCDTCHAVSPAAGSPAAGPDNSARLRETYGFGNGAFLKTDGDGNTHDLSAFLDANGELIGDFPHPNTGPVPADVRARAMAIEVVPHPRQPR